MRHWLYGKWERDAARRQDLADFEREYRHEAGLPEGPLDLLQQAGLDLALKTHELFMDRAFWGEGSGEMLGILRARKLAWHDPRLPMEPYPEWVGYFERAYSEALAWFEDETLQVQYRGESPLHTLMRRQGRVDEDGSVYGSASRRLGVSRQEVNLSREAMDLLASALDTTLEHYGTSEHADPRGYWMKLDVESDQGRLGDTKA